MKDHATDITRKIGTPIENQMVMQVPTSASLWKYHLWETGCKISLVYFFFFFKIIYKKQVNFWSFFIDKAIETKLIDIEYLKQKS